jgi:hypothetical protein
MKYDLTNSIDANSSRLYLDKLVEEGAKVELKKIRENRTIDQNSYLHAVIGTFAINTGYTMEEAKLVFKRKYRNAYPEMVYEKNGEKFLLSTSIMDTKQISDFIDWIRNYAAIEASIYIPTAEEYKANWFNIDKEINKHKEYL